MLLQKMESSMTCPHCADGLERESARRAYVLNLLALVEHPSALPPDAALRVARELLAWSKPDVLVCRGASPVVRPAEIETAA
jgi:hypothetical protein